jgi:hypothetical protein
MLTFKNFTGINNVIPTERLEHDPDPETGATELSQAVNVDIGLKGEVRRRAGYSEVLDTCHKNIHQGKGFLLATVDGGDLISMDEDGENRVTLYPSLGVSRVWYCNLPDGRTTFSNGLICGVTDGLTATKWGVPLPIGLGALTEISGDLDPGDYQYQLTYVRLSDGLEGGPIYSNPIPLTDGGIFLSGLPTLDDHAINIYLTGANGDEAFFAGSTTGSMFSYIGKNDALTIPCRTGNMNPAPAPTVTAFWRGRVLLAVGPVLYASRTNAWELFDFRRDFKQFSDNITLIQPVDGGVFVGTTTELAFLSGTEFDKLAYRQVVAGPTVLGSGVAVRGELLPQGEGSGLGSAMVCIADKVLVAGFSDGQAVRVTEGRYQTDVTEVAAVFRMVDRIPQYIAIPQ